MIFSWKQNRLKTWNTERGKTSVLKESVENSDLHKSVLNKVTTTHEECIKNNFAETLWKTRSVN